MAASPSTALSRGLGSWSTASLLATRGLGIAAAVVVTLIPDVYVPVPERGLLVCVPERGLTIPVPERNLTIHVPYVPPGNPAMQTVIPEREMFPDDILTYTWKMDDWPSLQADPIASATVTISPSGSLALVGSATVASGGRRVTTKFSGAVEDTEYSVKLVSTTTAGEKITAPLRITGVDI